MDIEKFVNEYCVKSNNRLISKMNLFKLYKEQNFKPIKFTDFKKYCDSEFETYTGICYAKKDYKRRSSHNVYKVYFKKDCLIFDSKIRKHDDYIERKHKNKYQNVEGFIYDCSREFIKLCNANGEKVGIYSLDGYSEDQKEMNSSIGSLFIGMKVRIFYSSNYGKKMKFSNVKKIELVCPKAKEKACYYVTSRQAEYFNENIIKFNDHISTKKIKENEILNSLSNS